MARYNKSIWVSFNDNDGGAGWGIDPSTCDDFARYQKIFGTWRTRWIMLKRFWRALTWMEGYADRHSQEAKPNRRWVFKAEIPE